MSVVDTYGHLWTFKDTFVCEISGRQGSSVWLASSWPTRQLNVCLRICWKLERTLVPMGNATLWTYGHSHIFLWLLIDMCSLLNKKYLRILRTYTNNLGGWNWGMLALNFQLKSVAPKSNNSGTWNTLRTPFYIVTHEIHPLPTRISKTSPSNLVVSGVDG